MDKTEELLREGREIIEYYLINYPRLVTENRKAMDFLDKAGKHLGPENQDINEEKEITDDN